MLASVAPVAPAGTGRPAITSTAWIAAAGAFLFLLGAAYGLAVSIERGWISPPVRVAAGLIMGVVAIFAAWRLLTAGRRALGVTLLAVGTGTWTFAWYFGAQVAALFPNAFGFAGAALAVLVAGLLAARQGSDGAMAVAVATGLVAPLAFSSGQGTTAGLAAYLAVLLGAQAAVNHLTGTGGGWRISRGVALGLVWLVMLIGALQIRGGSAVLAIAGVALLGAVALVLAWLPRHRELPWGAVGGTNGTLFGAGVSVYAIWERSNWADEAFSIVLLALAGVALGTVFFARERLGHRRSDAPLLLAALALTLLAVLVALSWKWVALVWSLLATVLAWASRHERAGSRFEGGALRTVARAAAVLATLHWLGSCVGQNPTEVMFFNPVFGAALFTSVAWAGLITGTSKADGVAFGAVQSVLVNAVAWEFARAVPAYSGEEGTLEFGALLSTLTYAGAGAAGWLRGVLHESEPTRARVWRFAGYVWLVAAAVKLLVFDLEQADLAFRAVAALAVGALFIGAAFWADRRQAR